MLAALTALLICQLAGEAVVQAAHLPLPGPVLGMAMLAVLMLVRSPLPRELDGTANGLLRHLALLFVPAGVGVVQQMGPAGQRRPAPAAGADPLDRDRARRHGADLRISGAADAGG